MAIQNAPYSHKCNRSQLNFILFAFWAALLFTTPSFAETEPQWLFPEDPLPQDLGTIPLFVSDDEGADIQAPQQDWFLLRNPISLAGELILRDSSPIGQVSFLNPQLDSENAQIYYRIMVGLILQETLAHLGLTPAHAEAYRRAEETQRFRLPEAFEQLRRQWPDRRMVLENVIPRWIEPLAIAVETSGLQHFARAPQPSLGRRDLGASRKQCSNFDQLRPLSDVRSRMKELEEERISIARGLEERAILIELAQSAARQLRSESLNLPDLLDELNKCRDHLIGFRDEAPVNQALVSLRNVSSELQNLCLQRLESLLARGERADIFPTVQSLIASSPANQETGSFLGVSLRLRQAQQDLIAIEEEVRQLHAQYIEAQQLTINEQAQENRQLAQETELRGLQQNFEITNRVLEAEMGSLRDEASQIVVFRAFIDRIRFVRASPENLENRERIWYDFHTFLEGFRVQWMSQFAQPSRRTSALPFELKIPETEQELDQIKAQIRVSTDDTFLTAMMSLLDPWAKMRLDQINALLAQLSEDYNRNIRRSELINAQLETISQQRVELLKNAISRQNIPEVDELLVSLNQLEVRRALIRVAVEELEDQLLILNSAIDVLRNESFRLRDQQQSLFQRSQAEQLRAQNLALELRAEQERAEQRLRPIEEQIANFNQQLEQYLSDQKMGWMFERECPSSELNNGSEDDFVYIARSTWSANPQEVNLTSAVGGHWGLFHFPYKSFSQAIDSGALLDSFQTVRLGVQSIDRLSTALRRKLTAATQGGTSICPGNQDTALRLRGPVAIYQVLHRAWMMGSEEEHLNSAICSSQLNSSPFTQLLRWNGSFLDQVLPQRGQAQPADLVERDWLEFLTAELAHWAGLTSEQSRQNWEDIEPKLMALLTTDYQALIRRLNTEVLDGFNRFRFASEAPTTRRAQSIPNPSESAIEIGKRLTILTLNEVPLFEAPVSEDAALLPLKLTYQDDVEILPIRLNETDEPVAERAGWIFVSVVSREPAVSAWMPSWGVDQGFVELPSGQLIDLKRVNCPNPREVVRLENFQANDRVVTRMLGGRNIPLSSSPVSGASQMSWAHQDRAEPTFLGRKHIACEKLQIEGHQSALVQHELSNYMGVRVIEAFEWQSPRGERYLIPLETEGGFVHPFLLGRNASRPRIELGAPIDKNQGWRVIRDRM